MCADIHYAGYIKKGYIDTEIHSSLLTGINQQNKIIHPKYKKVFMECLKQVLPTFFFVDIGTEKKT